MFSFVHGISQARILEWVAISFSRGSFQPRDQAPISCIADMDSLPSEPPGEPLNFARLWKQSVCFYNSPFKKKEKTYQNLSWSVGSKRTTKQLNWTEGWSIQNCHFRPETKKLVENNIGRTPFDINHSDIFKIWLLRQKKQKQARINKWDLTKLTDFYTAKETINC